VNFLLLFFFKKRERILIHNKKFAQQLQYTELENDIPPIGHDQPGYVKQIWPLGGPLG
jgi:hypothetical protein